MWPSRSVSICWSADSRRAGTSRYWRFGLPQLTRNLMTRWLHLTAVTLRGNRAVSKASRRWRMSGPRLYGRLERPPPRRAQVEGRTQRADISAFSSVPLPSSSIIWKTLRAAFRNSVLNSASARRAALSLRSRSAASCSRRFERPRWMASSLRAATGELRTRTVASMASQVGRYDRVIERTPPDVPLLFVDLAGVVRVQDFERLLQPRRVEEELQIFLAARRQEPDDFLVGLDLCFVDR